MFEFFLSVRVSFWLVGAGRMPRRCAATSGNKCGDSFTRPLVDCAAVHTGCDILISVKGIELIYLKITQYIF